LEPIRNALSHANPISEHQALRVFCYAQDVIESIKEHYTTMGAGDDFNAPCFVSFSDSAGNTLPVNKPITQFELTKTKFREGDRIRLEVEVDSSLEDVTIDWDVLTPITEGRLGSGPSITFDFQSRHVNQRFQLVVTVKSKKNWHRLGNHDAQLIVAYTVLPLS
jgi:hypothetical protein